MSQYQFTLSFALSTECPTAVVEFFQATTAGAAPDALPDADEAVLQAPADEVIALLAGAQLVERQVTVAGQADAAAFYMPFVALCEWLARYVDAEGPVGYYHLAGALHPTLLYFAGGKPYMLQATGVPVGMVDGAAMPSDV